jgi:hypothetical protein
LHIGGSNAGGHLNIYAYYPPPIDRYEESSITLPQLMESHALAYDPVHDVVHLIGGGRGTIHDHHWIIKWEVLRTSFKPLPSAPAATPATTTTRTPTGWGDYLVAINASGAWKECDVGGISPALVSSSVISLLPL